MGQKNLKEQRLRRADKRVAGICRDCTELAMPGKAQCEYHLVAGKLQARRKRARRRLRREVAELLPLLRAGRLPETPNWASDLAESLRAVGFIPAAVALVKFQDRHDVVVLTTALEKML